MAIDPFYVPEMAAIQLETTAASTAGCLRRDDVTLTFDLLTPKRNQFIFVPRRTNEQSLAQIHH